MTTTSNWTDEDTRKAQAAWAEYQRQYDVSDRHGQVVGIDPRSGGVWIGADLVAVKQMAHADGVDTPLLCLRVGYSYYQRKQRWAVPTLQRQSDAKTNRELLQEEY